MEKRLIPQLRFPEFEDEWEFEKLKNVSSYFNGGSFESNVLEKGKYELITLKSINVEGGLVSSQKHIDIEVPTLRKDTLIMILSEQAPGLLGMTTLIPKNNKYVLNQRVAEIRPNNKIDSFFLSLAINRNQRYFSRLGAGTKVQNITKPNVENYVFLRPQLPEQQKIASFLTDVDDKITQLTKKKKLLEKYKKGVMQKIFSQALRFKDDYGNAFPDWEVKKLGGIAKINMGQSPDSSSYNSDGDGYYLIQGNADITNRKTTPRNWTNKPTKLCDVGDLILTVRAPVGAVAKSIHNACIGRGVCSIKNTPISNIEFIYQFLLDYEKRWTRLEQGSTFTAVSGKDIKSIEINLPSIEEQVKIANFLSDIDVKLEALNAKIEQSKVFKKGLLQKMFV